MSRIEPPAADLAERQARNLSLSRSLLATVQGVDAIEQVAALITAATTVIETRFAPKDRLTVLNAMLGDTIRGWAPSPVEARIE